MDRYLSYDENNVAIVHDMGDEVCDSMWLHHC